MSFNKWPKRSAEKNYFMVPNEIFSIGLDYREISLYIYLLRCENRKTYQCYGTMQMRGEDGAWYEVIRDDEGEEET